MKTIRFFTIALLGLVVVSCHPSSSKINPQEYGFYDLTKGNENDVLINYAGNTLLVIHLSDIVLKHAESEPLRGHAAAFAESQRRIFNEYKKLATNRKIRLPKMFMQEQVNVIQMMKSKEGASLNKSFIRIVEAYNNAFGDSMEMAMQEKGAHGTVLEFARLVDAQQQAHQAETKELLKVLALR